MVFLKTTQKLHAVLVRNVSEVVDGDRHLPPDYVAHVRHVFLQIVEAFLRDVDAGVAMGCREELERLAAHRTGVDRSMRRLYDVFHLAHVREIAQRCDHSILYVREKLDSKIHL